jgi:hypothetical protein
VRQGPHRRQTLEKLHSDNKATAVTIVTRGLDPRVLLSGGAVDAMAIPRSRASAWISM